MTDLTLELNKTKETVNKIVFSGPNQEAPIPSVYINKSIFKGTIPEKITIKLSF